MCLLHKCLYNPRGPGYLTCLVASLPVSSSLHALSKLPTRFGSAARSPVEGRLTGHVVLLQAVGELQGPHCFLPAVLHLLQQQKHLERDASPLLVSSPGHRDPATQEQPETFLCVVLEARCTLESVGRNFKSPYPGHSHTN